MTWEFLSIIGSKDRFSSVYEAISSSFSVLDNCFILYSLCMASLFVEHSSAYLKTTGYLVLVYFAPRPLLCLSVLFLRSFVHPVYKVLSRHSNIYTQYNSSCPFYTNICALLNTIILYLRILFIIFKFAISPGNYREPYHKRYY